MNKKIIVIGNGSSVLNYELGGIIDTFEDIVRFNDYIIKGYEKHIGSKITIWARSNSRRTKERDWGQFKRVIVCSPEWNYRTVDKLIKGKSNAEVVSKNQSLSLQKELGLPGRKRNNTKNVFERGWPSTGLLLLDYLLKEYEQIYIHGFDGFNKIGGHPRHYYNNNEKMQTTYVHDGNKEKAWIEQKIKENKIKILKDNFNE